jgi:hypothetical protein
LKKIDANDVNMILNRFLELNAVGSKYISEFNSFLSAIYLIDSLLIESNLSYKGIFDLVFNLDLLKVDMVNQIAAKDMNNIRSMGSLINIPYGRPQIGMNSTCIECLLIYDCIYDTQI